MESEPFVVHPIGIFHGPLRHRYETPRQGVLARDSEGIIELFPRRNFEQALVGLSDFERVWIIFLFHKNLSWKPLVHVPRHLSGKIGVFATRAPYRPNRIGLTCARLDGIEGLRLHLREIDLLDGSPILDIKPYLPYADSFPDAATAWVGDAHADLWSIVICDAAQSDIDWLGSESSINLRGFIDVQLQHDPDNVDRKRITPRPIHDNDAVPGFTLAYRTWRIDYRIDRAERIVLIDCIRSGYTLHELNDARDVHGDKHIHRRFLLRQGSSR